MENELNKMRNKAVKKIKALSLTIKQLELENYNLELKSNHSEAQYNSIKSRNADLLKQIHDFKKNEIQFKRQLEQYERSISVIKQHLKLDTIEEIASYIKVNIIERNADLHTKEAEILALKNTVTVEQPLITELPDNIAKRKHKV